MDDRDNIPVEDNDNLTQTPPPDNGDFRPVDEQQPTPMPPQAQPPQAQTPPPAAAAPPQPPEDLPEDEPEDAGMSQRLERLGGEPAPVITPEEFARLQKAGQVHIDSQGRVKTTRRSDAEAGVSLRKRRAWYGQHA